MKNILKSKLVLFTLILLMVLSPLCLASNIEATSENEAVMESDDLEASYEFIASDLYEFDSDVVIDSIVDGNVFAFGDNVTISGEIGGDVFVFGNNVTISDTGYIHGSIFVFGNNTTMNGICYDVYGFSSNFTLGEDAIIARDVRIATNKMEIYGQVRRNAYIVTNDLIFGSNSGTLISGNLEYWSDSQFEISEGVVGGATTYKQTESNKSLSFTEVVVSYVKDIVSTLLYSLVIVLLIIWLAPKFKERISKIFKKQAPLSLGVGILASIAIVIVAFVLLLITGGLGFGISVAAVTIFILALTISQTVFSIGCAKLIISKMNKSNNGMLILFTELIVLAISLVGIIPIVGGFVEFVCSMIGLGIIILNIISKKNLDDESADNIVIQK